MKTEAFVIQQTGRIETAFQKTEFEIGTPGDNDLLIEVEAFGLNYADVMAARGLYAEMPKTPCVVGYEVTGRIQKVGKNVPADWVGKKVLSFTRFGGYAKHVIVPMHAAQLLKEDEDGVTLLSLVTQGATAFFMTEMATQMYPKDKVLIHAAAGGVGTFLIQLVKRRGATAIAKIGNDSKSDYVKHLGADIVVNYNHADYTEQLKGKGFQDIDVSFNPVAGPTYKKDFKHLAFGGRMLLYGGSALGNYAKNIFGKINFMRSMGILLPIVTMMQSKSLIGINMLKIGDRFPERLSLAMKGIYDLYAKGEIQLPKTTIYSESDFLEAFKALDAGKTMGKLVIKWDK